MKWKINTRQAHLVGRLRILGFNQRRCSWLSVGILGLKGYVFGYVEYLNKENDMNLEGYGDNIVENLKIATNRLDHKLRFCKSSEDKVVMYQDFMEIISVLSSTESQICINTMMDKELMVQRVK